MKVLSASEPDVGCRTGRDHYNTVLYRRTLLKLFRKTFYYECVYCNRQKAVGTA
jgi:hypothetical protein